MVALSGILDERSIELDLRARYKREALEELVGVLGRSIPVGDPRAMTEGLLARERLASTGVGRGVAIPHRLVPGFPRTVMAFGRRREGIPFDTIDGLPVSLFFLLLGPDGSQGEHLRLLSRLARFLHDEALLRELHAAVRPGEVLEAIRRREEGPP